jgi:hypothetical protein
LRRVCLRRSPIPTESWDDNSAKVSLVHRETVSENTPEPTMDHRGLLVMHRGLVIVGGMEKGQQVTAKVTLVKPARGK